MNEMHEDVCIIELCFVPYSYDEEKLTFKAKVCINIHTDELFRVKKEITLNLFSTRKEIIVMHVYHYYIIGSNSTCSTSKIFYN